VPVPPLQFPDLVAVDLGEYVTPLRVLVLDAAADHHRAVLELDHLWRDFRLQGLADFLQGLDVNLRLGTGLESALEQVAAADNGDVARGARAAVTAAGRGDAGEDGRAAGDQLPRLSALSSW
jgi:hypothetical protein